MNDAADARRSSLSAMIAAHRPADPVERGHAESLLRLLETASSPFARSHFVPGHVTASAFVVDPARARLLLHHHRRLDRWLQMGGHLDDGEPVVVAALREAREESGLQDLTLPLESPFDVDVHHIPAGRGEPPHLHFDVRFVLFTHSPDTLVLAPEESTALAWHDLDVAVARMSSPESARAIAKIRRILG